MRKQLKKIQDSIKCRLHLVEQMTRQAVDIKSEKDRNKIMLADCYLIYQEISKLSRMFELIANECVSELNGSYFLEHVQAYLESDTDYDPAKHNVYATIIGMIEEKNLIISEDLKIYI